MTKTGINRQQTLGAGVTSRSLSREWRAQDPGVRCPRQHPILCERFSSRQADVSSRRLKPSGACARPRAGRPAPTNLVTLARPPPVGPPAARSDGDCPDWACRVWLVRAATVGPAPGRATAPGRPDGAGRDPLRRVRHAARLRPRRRRRVVRGRLPARRERLWQMELYRRASSGRLSEVLGPTTLRVDKRFIGLGLRRAANEEWQTATPLVRTALERYCRGVNAAVAAMGRWRRPPEFLALGIEPEPWTPVDSLSVARLLSWRLAENRWGELVRGRLTGAIGAAEASRLMGVWPAGAPTIVEAAAPVAPTSASDDDRAPARSPLRARTARLPRARSTNRPCRRGWDGWTSGLAPAAATAGSSRRREARPAVRCWPTTRIWPWRCRRSGTKRTSWPPGSTSPASRFPRRRL